MKQIVAGGDHTCALFEADGSAFCWGLKNDGQATPPADNKDFSYLVAGVYFTCGVKKNAKQEVLCWGRDIEKATTVPEGLRVHHEL